MARSRAAVSCQRVVCPAINELLIQEQVVLAGPSHGNLIEVLWDGEWSVSNLHASDLMPAGSIQNSSREGPVLFYRSHQSERLHCLWVFQIKSH